MIITFLGNFSVSYSSENHHALSLNKLGHGVHKFQEQEATSDDLLLAALQSDVFVWVHTHGWNTPGSLTMVEVLERLRDKGIPTVTYHLDLWFGIDRQRDLETDEFYKHIQHFFTVDKKMADWFNAHTGVQGHYLQAGVFDEECKLIGSAEKPYDVIFVGSKGYHHEWPYRPKLIEWLQHTYGDRFRHYGGDGLGVIRGHELNELYGKSKVVVGDSLCIGFDYPWYWSDRVYETLGRGGFMIHPYITGMGEHFEDGKHLKFYTFNDWNMLKAQIDYYLSHEDERERIRIAGHDHVKNNHTYVDRWRHILEVVNG